MVPTLRLAGIHYFRSLGTSYWLPHRTGEHRSAEWLGCRPQISQPFTMWRSCRTCDPPLSTKLGFPCDVFDPSSTSLQLESPPTTVMAKPGQLGRLS